ncbi:MAG: hypothetical protein RL204_848 [Bacteroidota bacterium]|jgi:GT2 family glycosyltransferase
MKKVLITLVNYFGETQLVNFIQSQLLKQQGIDLHICIVDNGSKSTDLLEEIAQTSSNITLISANENLGYIGAASLSYSHFQANGLYDFDYFILSNYDIIYSSTDAIATLITQGSKNSFAVFGPQIKTIPQGSYSNPMFQTRISKSHLKRLLLVNSWYPFSYAYQLLHNAKKQKKASSSFPSTAACYAIHGSVMVFSNEFFKANNTLDYPSFLYGEEIYIAEQCLQKNLKVGFISEVEVIHDEHITTGKIKNRKHMIYLRDSLRFLNNHFFKN